MSSIPSRPRVVIAGGGVAAVECALALHDLAGDRVRLTLVAPNREFALWPLSTAEPFSRDHVRRHSLAALAARVGAQLVPGAVTRVDGAAHRVDTDRGAIGYDLLVLATGGRHVPALRKAITFTGERDAIDYHGLLRDVDEGYSHAVSFVVPPGTTWPLPLYELALMTAREAWSMGIDDIRMELVTPEERPLGLFGTAAADAMSGLLERARIDFRGATSVREDDPSLRGHRVVALPTIEGLAIDGVPADPRGFVPVDDQLKVVGLPDVWAAGDGTTFPVKQGGIACQQADAIAEQLAARAGAPVEAEPFRPVLRGRVLAGHGAQYLERGDAPSELRLWSVSRKIDGRYLSPWLQELEDAPVPANVEDDASRDAIDVHLDLDDERLPTLDPFLPRG